MTDALFYGLAGGWAVGVLYALARLEVVLRELVQLSRDTDHKSCTASPLNPPG
jgi:hypothetical protein